MLCCGFNVVLTTTALCGADHRAGLRLRVIGRADLDLADDLDGLAQNLSLTFFRNKQACAQSTALASMSRADDHHLRDRAIRCIGEENLRRLATQLQL